MNPGFVICRDLAQQLDPCVTAMAKSKAKSRVKRAHSAASLYRGISCLEKQDIKTEPVPSLAEQIKVP